MLDQSVDTHKTRADVARENGAKSHGPVTPEGKARAAQNSYKHGLTASTVVFPDVESTDQYIESHQRLIATWKPVNPVEEDLVEEMAVCKWQERRMWGIETDTFDIQIQIQANEYKRMCTEDGGNGKVAVAFGTLADGKRLDLMLRYRGQSNRHYYRAMNQLLKLRKERALENAPAEPEPSNPEPLKEKERNEPTTAPKPNTTNGHAPESFNPEPTPTPDQHPTGTPIAPETPPDDQIQ